MPEEVATLAGISWEEHRLGRLPHEFLENLPQPCYGCAFADLGRVDDEELEAEAETQMECTIDLKKVRPRIPDELFPAFYETIVKVTQLPLSCPPPAPEKPRFQLRLFESEKSRYQLRLFEYEFPVEYELPVSDEFQPKSRVLGVIYYPEWWCLNEDAAIGERFEEEFDRCCYFQPSKYPLAQAKRRA